MDRRDALRILAGTAAIPVLPAQLRALSQVLRPAQAGPAFQVLDPHQQATVAAIADLIIPATDTPGATAAGVPRFIDQMLVGWVDADERDHFLAGLADVDQRSRAQSGKPFVECTAAEQTSVLTVLDYEVAAERDAERSGVPRGRFFRTMKRLTVVGYYTSEIGAEQELHYQIVPGRFDGCAPLRRV